MHDAFSPLPPVTPDRPYRGSGFATESVSDMYSNVTAWGNSISARWREGCRRVHPGTPFTLAVNTHRHIATAIRARHTRI
jgi:hypothetical protein